MCEYNFKLFISIDYKMYVLIFTRGSTVFKKVTSVSIQQLSSVDINNNYYL